MSGPCPGPVRARTEALAQATAVLLDEDTFLGHAVIDTEMATGMIRPSVAAQVMLLARPYERLGHTPSSSAAG